MIMSPLLRIGAGSVIFLLLMSPNLPAAQSSPSRSTPIMRSAYGNKLKLPGLPNSGHINDNLYRGAQPHSEGLQELKKLGITTIVDLRDENPQLGESERQQAEKLGIRFVNIPVSGWAPPSNEQVAQFLSIFRNNPNERVFVHCRFGDDRTGVFVATYRMAYENWPAEQAMNEMYYFGFNGFWHPSMKAFIRDFPARLKTAPALVEYRYSDPIVTKCNNPAGDPACSK
jgi:tyrosine-protein phosphatase SIW14